MKTTPVRSQIPTVIHRRNAAGAVVESREVGPDGVIDPPIMTEPGDVLWIGSSVTSPRVPVDKVITVDRVHTG